MKRGPSPKKGKVKIISAAKKRAVRVISFSPFPYAATNKWASIGRLPPPLILRGELIVFQ
jgi:hypothetical protein